MWPTLLVCMPHVMMEGDSWRHSHLIFGGEVLGFAAEKPLRKNLPMETSVNKNESWEVEHEQTPSWS